MKLKRKNKRGMEKELIISLVLGLIIVALVLYFIFHEYFTTEEMDLEACRQSIVLRATMPEKDLYQITVSGKDTFPLKCKTQVVNIDYKDKLKAEKEIIDTMASCWYMVGEGKYTFFASNPIQLETRCLICARIHFDDKIKDYYVAGEGKDNRINFNEALDMKMENSKKTYWNYFQDNGKNVALLFLGWDNDLKIIKGPHKGKSKWWWATTLGLPDLWAGIKEGFGAFVQDQSGVIYPKYYDYTKGDLLIVSSHPALSEENRDNWEVPSFLIFLHQSELEKLSKGVLATRSNNNWVPCDSYETIPA